MTNVIEFAVNKAIKEKVGMIKHWMSNKREPGYNFEISESNKVGEFELMLSWNFDKPKTKGFGAFDLFQYENPQDLWRNKVEWEKAIKIAEKKKNG